MDKQNSWPEAFVALGMIAMVGGVTWAGINKYATVDDALKIWASFDTFVGVLTGAVGTYFFSRKTTEAAKAEAASAKSATEAVKEANDTATKEVKEAHAKQVKLLAALVDTAGRMDPPAFERWRRDPTIAGTLDVH